MFQRNGVKYILIGLGSLLFGWIFYTYRNKNTAITPDANFNKTIAVEKDGKYFLIFNSVVVLTNQISKEQYDNFIKQYPSGKADGNVLKQYYTVQNKYTIEDGDYYEYVWDGTKYGNKIKISKDEYDYETSGITLDNYINI